VDNAAQIDHSVAVSLFKNLRCVMKMLNFNTDRKAAILIEFYLDFLNPSKPNRMGHKRFILHTVKVIS
jgi:hypothetical protein